MSEAFVNNIRLDWLEFTYGANSKDSNLFESFLADFPYIDSILESRCVESNCDKGAYFLEHARNGYKNALILTDGCSVMWSYGSPRMGVHVTIPSHGLSAMLPLLCCGLTSVCDCICYLLDNSCKITRLDVCFDDKDRRFLPYRFNDWMRNEQIRTRCRRWAYMESVSGATFTIGSRESGRFVRIYDKDGEQKAAEKTFGIRYEVELRANYAHALAKELTSDCSYTFGDLLSTIFTVVEPFDIKQKDVSAARSHAAVLADWAEFLDSCLFKRLKSALAAPKRPDPTFEQMVAFVDRSISKAVSVFSETFGLDKTLELIASLLCGNKDDLYKKRLLACANAKAQGATLQDAYSFIVAERSSKIWNQKELNKEIESVAAARWKNDKLLCDNYRKRKNKED